MQFLDKTVQQPKNSDQLTEEKEDSFEQKEHLMNQEAYDNMLKNSETTLDNPELAKNNFGNSEPIEKQQIANVESSESFADINNVVGVNLETSEPIESQELFGYSFDISNTNVLISSVVSYDNVVKDNSPNSKVTKTVKVLNPCSSKSPQLKFKCDHCDQKYVFKNTLQRHVREFHTENVNKFTCELCNVEFGRKDNLNLHIASKMCVLSEDPNNSNLQCNKCKKICITKDKLKNHEMYNCINKYFCTYCLKFFKKKKDFLTHNH